MASAASPASHRPLRASSRPSALRSPLPLSLGPLSWPTYDPENNHALIEMEAGITIHDLNKMLEQRDLGLMNMGGYDGQTIIGATSTSTHGSGITLPPFPDMVCSLVLATTGRWNGPTTGGKEPTDGVYFYRIEPKNGITDPAKYKDPLVQLIQDDDCFYSAICSMGCFGVIYSVVFEVMQMYWLEETRMETTLDKLISDLRPDTSTPGHFPKVLQNTRNYEVIIHPYPMKDGRVIDMDPGAPPETYYPYFSCLVTQRHSDLQTVGRDASDQLYLIAEHRRDQGSPRPRVLVVDRRGGDEGLGGTRRPSRGSVLHFVLDRSTVPWS
jgi:FAD binding domain